MSQSGQNLHEILKIVSICLMDRNNFTRFFVLFNYVKQTQHCFGQYDFHNSTVYIEGFLYYIQL